MAVTWAECFAVHDLGREDLLPAVVALYADDTRDKSNRTLPADVIRHARRLRRDRSEREATERAIAPGSPASEERRAEILGRLRGLAESKSIG